MSGTSTPSAGDPHPHDLGILSHYAAVLWYLGDNRLTQDPEDVITELPAFGLNRARTASVAERQQYLTIAVRDYLNEGGKLLYAGETTGVRRAARGARSAASSAASTTASTTSPRSSASSTADPFSDCLLLADDFFQYYLGAFDRNAVDGAGSVVGTAGPMAGDEAAFGGPATVENPVDEVGAFTVTSDLLPPDAVPAVRQRRRRSSTSTSVGTLVAVEGEFAAVANHADESYMRLGRTFDLTGITAAEAPDVRGAAVVVDRGRRSTTSSSRRTPSARTTGRRCPTSTATRRTDVPARVRGGLLHRPAPEPGAGT